MGALIPVIRLRLAAAMAIALTGSWPLAAQPAGQSAPPRAIQPGADAKRGTAVLRGTIVAADTGAPLRKADVNVSGTAGQDYGQTTTDDDGRFELRGLVGGRYTLTASKGGFISLQYGQRRPAERGTPIDLAAGQTLDKITLSLPRGGVIAGRITDEAGEPAIGAQVQVLRYGFARGGRRLQSAGRTDSTDDQGSFRIYGLNPGDYYVSATLRSGRMMPVDRLAQDDPQGYAPTYYPGTPSRGDAERIAVGVGQEVGGITFALTPTRVARISGRVIGLAPDRTGAFVTARADDGVGLASGTQAGAPVTETGTFLLAGVPPGRYWLQVQTRGTREDDALVGMVTVSVAGADLSNVVIAMQRLGTITGRIEFEGGVPSTVRPSQVRVYANAVDDFAARTFVSSAPQTTDDFTFTVRGALGPVTLQPNPPRGWYLKSVTLDGEDITETPVPLVAGSNVTGVRVLLTQNRSTLSGAVRDDRGTLVLDATVIVFPDDETRWSTSTRRIRTSRPDTQGRFELLGLPPGTDYRIAAVRDLEDGQAFDPEFLAGLRDRAERLTLAEGETKTVDLQLRQ